MTFSRINKYCIEIPPLRERRDEIGSLVEHFTYALGKRFFNKEVTLSPESIEVLKEYHWPGNIRELEGLVERAIVDNADFIKDGEGKVLLHTEHIKRFLAENKTAEGKIFCATFTRRDVLPNYYNTILTEYEKAYLRELMVRSKGNHNEAARISGFSVKTLRRKLKKLAMDDLYKRC